MIQLELQMIETEIQTAKDYGLQPGDRADGLEQFRDIVTSGAQTLGFGGVISEFNQTKDTFYKDVSTGASIASANREPGVRK